MLFRSYVLNYDFSIYDDEFLTKNGKEENLFLEDIDVSLTSRDPVLFVRKTVEIGSKKISTHAFGTRIEISNLKGSWSEIKVENVYRDIARLQSIFDFDTNGKIGNNDFEVVIYKDKKRQSFEERFLEKLHFLLEERSVVSVENGCFDGERRISFNINGSPFEIDIFNPYFTSLHPFRKNYNNGAKTLKERKVECGKFSFVFYIFDLSNKAPSKYRSEERRVGKQCR